MTKFDVDASLFRVAAMFQSTEETRYYLNGVHIEPHHEEGVFLVATDGHRLFVAHDATGKIEGGTAIVQLGKDQLRACRQGRGETAPRRIVATDAKQPLTINANDAPVAVQAKWIIDGSFPDWKRIMKGLRPEGRLDAVDGDLLRSFAEAAKAFTGVAKIEFSHSTTNGPAIVRFANVANAFGVLMPLAWKGERGWPSFLGFDPDPAPEPEVESEAA